MNDPKPTPAPTPKRSRLRLVRRVALGLGLGLFAVVAIALAVFLLVAPAREAALRKGLDAGLASLPGTISVESRWPSPGTVELRDLVWTADADTVARVQLARVALDLGAAVMQRAVVDEIRLEGVDFRPAAMPSFSDTAATAPVDTTTAGSPLPIPWFAGGRIDLLPHVEVRSFVVRDLRVDTGEQIAAVDALDLRLDLGREASMPWFELDLDARVDRLAHLRWSLRGESDGLRFRSSPVTITKDATDVSTEAGFTLDVDDDVVARALAGDDLDLRFDGTLVDGDLATLDARGSLRGERVALDGRMVLARTTALLRDLTVMAGADTVAAVRRLLDTWPSDDPYTIDLDVDGTASDLTAALEADLPGPAAAIDPATLPVDLGDARRTRGRITARGNTAGRMDVTLDLTRSAWLDRARVVASLDGSAVRVDSLALAVPGVRVDGRATADGDDVTATLSFAVDGSALAWSDSAAAALPIVDVRGTANVDGSLPLPDVELRVDGSARGDFGEVPTARVRAFVRDGRVDLEVETPEASTVADVSIAPTRLGWSGTVTRELDAVQGRLDLDTGAEDVAFVLSTRLDADRTTGLRATIDSMRVRGRGMRWGTRGPFRVEADTTGRLLVEDLDIDGDLGRLRLDTVSAGDSIRTRLDADLRITRDLLTAVLPESLHASIPADTTAIRLEARTRGRLAARTMRARLGIELLGENRIGPVALEARAWLRGDDAPAFAGAPEDLPPAHADVEIDVLHGGRPWITARARAGGVVDLQSLAVRPDGSDLSVEVRGDSIDVAQVLAMAGARSPVDGLVDARIDAAVTAAGDVLVDTLAVNTRLGSVRGSGRWENGTIDLGLDASVALARADLEALLATGSGGFVLPADSVAIDLALDATGTPTEPFARADVRVRTPASESLPPVEISTRAWFGDAARSPYPPLVPGDDARGLQARLRISDPDTTWVHATADLPLQVRLDPPGVARIEGRPLRVQLDTPSLDVDRLTRLAGLSRTGTFQGDLEVALDLASDDGETIDVDGRIASKRLRGDLVDGSWFEAAADVRLGGTQRKPQVDGGITLKGAVIRIPEVPPSLLPDEGEALLWSDRAVQEPDSAVAVTPPAPAAAASDSVLVALDVGLDIPGELRLIGMGLDVALGGRLDVRARNDDLLVVGELQATRGSYEFLGRRFQVQTGVVTFFGDLDPRLNLTLSTSLQTTTYYVEITGTAQKPRFALRSDPSMSEGDIVSSLLFGRPADELDEGQSDLLRQRTQEVAAQMGARLLAARVGQQIGVDILSIQSSSEGEGQALVVGKYLSPDVLVQYERVLDESATSLVKLEYALSRFFKIETTASQGDHSGVEFKWSRDY